MPTLSLLLMLAFAVAACSCVVAERKVARLYADHTMIRLSGFFAALAMVAAGVWVYLII